MKKEEQRARGQIKTMPIPTHSALCTPNLRSRCKMRP